jgi:hypothetical protein
MTKAKVGGYGWRYEVGRALRANQETREVIRRLVEDEPGRGMVLLLASRAAIALGTQMEALRELEKIGENARNAKDAK